MTIRVEHQKNYTCITNSTIRDKRLSFKARGLHHLLLSYPDGWQVKIEHLVGESEEDGRTAIASGLSELEKYGYLERKQTRDPSTGKLGEWESIIRECPTGIRKPDCGADRKRETRKQETRKRETRKRETESIINTNTEQISKKEVSTLPLPPQGEKEGERNFGFEIKQELVTQPLATLLSQPQDTQVVNQIVVKADIAPTRVDPFFNKRRAPEDIEWDWLPDGPWRTEEGKLNNEFRTAIAQRWVKEHGGDLHEKRAKVLKHFRNEPTNLPIEWEWYQTITVHKAANIQSRKFNGMDTATDEQEILKHSAALKELPDEMRVTESKSPSKLVEEVAGYATKYIEQVEPAPVIPALESVATVPDDIWEKVKAQTEEHERSATTTPEGAENPQMYKQSIDLDARAYFEKLDQQNKQSQTLSTPMESSDNLKLVAEQIKNLAAGKSMPKVSDQDKREKTKLSRWNDLLATGLPSVMADAERQAIKAGYIIVDGQVVEPEF